MALPEPCDNREQSAIDTTCFCSTSATGHNLNTITKDLLEATSLHSRNAHHQIKAEELSPTEGQRGPTHTRVHVGMGSSCVGSKVLRRLQEPRV